jgi:hypothetical protein
VRIVKTPDSILEAQLKAWDKVIAEQSKESFFRKVIESQKAWVKRTAGYLSANNLTSAALDAAYRHFLLRPRRLRHEMLPLRAATSCPCALLRDVPVSICLAVSSSGPAG